jgi:hypothetical protein
MCAVLKNKRRCVQFLNHHVFSESYSSAGGHLLYLVAAHFHLPYSRGRVKRFSSDGMVVRRRSPSTGSCLPALIVVKWALSTGGSETYVIKNVQYGTYISYQITATSSFSFGSQTAASWLIQSYKGGYVYVPIVAFQHAPF